MRLVHALPHTAWPAGHWQVPATHVWPMPQIRPHAPQLRTSVAGSTQVPLHSSRGAMHEAAVEQTPATQARPDMHALPQRPQWGELVASAISQPLASVTSQSPKPAAQVKPQAPIAQVAAVLGRVWHAIPHPPQWATVTRVSTSQPLAAMASQLP